MRPVLVHSVAAAAIAGACCAATFAADVLAQLGIPVQAARDAVAGAISSGLYNPGLPSQAFKLLSPAGRAAVATAGVAWLKTYTASAEFAQQYAKLRDAHKPETPQFDGTPEQELQKAADEQKQQAEESKKAIAGLPPEQRKALEQALETSAAQVARMDTPEMRKVRLDEIRMVRADRTKRYEQELANWTRDYPEKPAGALARRLREFLAVSADVDFAATLQARGSRMQFENPAYEAKPAAWKLCYRAGREATAAARAAVSAWLKELAP